MQKLVDIAERAASDVSDMVQRLRACRDEKNALQAPLAAAERTATPGATVLRTANEKALRYVRALLGADYAKGREALRLLFGNERLRLVQRGMMADHLTAIFQRSRDSFAGSAGRPP